MNTIIENDNFLKKFVTEQIQKFIFLNYNTSLITYGLIGSGKSHFLFEKLLPIICESLLSQQNQENQLAYIEAYELSFDKQTNTERKTLLIQPPKDSKNQDPKHSQKSQQNVKIQIRSPQDFDYIFNYIKQNSQNFHQDSVNNSNKRFLPNQSHLFIKLHIMRDNRVQTFSIVDLAGVHPKDKQVYFERKEINASNNYLHYLLKSMSCSRNSQYGQQNIESQSKTPKLNKNSKIFKEIDSIINGNSKINILYVRHQGSEEEQGDLQCLKFIERLENIRIPLIKQKKAKSNEVKNVIDVSDFKESELKLHQEYQLNQVQIALTTQNNRKKWIKQKREQLKSTIQKYEIENLEVEEVPEMPQGKIPSPAKKSIELTSVLNVQQNSANIESEHSFARNIQDQQNYFQRYEHPTILITQNTQDNIHQDEAQVKKSLLKSEISEIFKLIDQKQPTNKDSYQGGNQNSYMRIQENASFADQQTQLNLQFNRFQSKINSLDEQVHIIMLRTDQLLESQPINSQELKLILQNVELVQNDLQQLIEEGCLLGLFQQFKDQFREFDQILAQIKDQLINIQSDQIIQESQNNTFRQRQNEQQLNPLRKSQQSPVQQWRNTNLGNSYQQPARKTFDWQQMQLKLANIYEKFYNKLQSLVQTPEGRQLALKKSNTQQLQRIENTVNTLSDLVSLENQEKQTFDEIADMMNMLYDELVQIFGKSDSDIRHINKLLRDTIYEQSQI
eukprot:403356975